MSSDRISLEQLRSLPPDEAAALWTVRQSQGTEAAEDNAFDEWLALSPENADAWVQASRAWASFDAAESESLFQDLRSEALRATRRPPIFRQLAVAAAILAVVGGGLAVTLGGESLFNLVRDPEQSGNSTQTASLASLGVADFSTALGERRTVQLPDGSRVTLDSATQIDVAYASKQRDIRLLQGRAYFDVGADAARPFAVTADDREITALGTQFDVRLDPGKLKVVLVEGRVSVTRPGSSEPTYLLKAGQQFVAESGEKPAVVPAAVDEVRNWQRGYASFSNSTLADAVTELNRSARVQLVVRDPYVAKLRISGMFRTGDAERFIKALSQVHPVRGVRLDDTHIEIVRRR
jgi:transmembrane sensor